MFSFGTLTSEEINTGSSEFELILDEAQQVNALIDATKQSLVRLERLKKLIQELKDTEQLCMKYPKDQKLLYKLAQIGHETYLALQEAHLEDYFRSEFLSELKKLYEIADKKTIPPAR